MRIVIRSLALAATLLLVAPAPAAAMPDDVGDTLSHAVVHAKVRAALLDKLGTDALRINIDLKGNQVHLTGDVTKQSSIEMAKQVALSVDGVANVHNHLTLKPSEKASDGTRTDLEDALLESKVKSKLLADVGKNALDIEVEVSEGVVSLRGTVPSSNVKEMALSTAKSTKGVRKVIDLLKTS